MRDDLDVIIRENREEIEDKFEGWEIVEFLQISTEDVIDAMLEFGWIDEDNIEDLCEFLRIKREGSNDDA